MGSLLLSVGSLPCGAIRWLDSPTAWGMLRAMKRIFQVVLLAAMAVSLGSCGLPGALMRTAGNTVNSAVGLLGGGR